MAAFSVSSKTGDGRAANVIGDRHYVDASFSQQVFEQALRLLQGYVQLPGQDSAGFEPNER